MIWIGVGLVFALVGALRNDKVWIEWGVVFAAIAVAVVFIREWWSAHKVATD